MPTTNYGWPYPISSSAPNVPLDIKALADAADASLDAVDDRLDLVEVNHSRGIIKRGRRITSSAVAASATAAGVLRVDSIPLLANRSYTITTGTLHPTSSGTTDTIRSEIRFSTTGAATTASTVLPGLQSFTAFGSTTLLEAEYIPATNQTLSILLCVARFSGTGNCQFYADGTRITELRVIDNGVDVTDTGVDL